MLKTCPNTTLAIEWDVKPILIFDQRAKKGIKCESEKKRHKMERVWRKMAAKR